MWRASRNSENPISCTTNNRNAYDNCLDYTPHHRRLLCPASASFVDNGPQGRQPEFLHRRAQVIVADGDGSHDRRQHLGRDVHLRAGSGAGGRLRLPADGTGILRGIGAGGMGADSHLLPDEPREYLRLPGAPLRAVCLPHGGVVLLRVENAGGIGALLRGVRGAADAGVCCRRWCSARWACPSR